MQLATTIMTTAVLVVFLTFVIITTHGFFGSAERLVPRLVAGKRRIDIDGTFLGYYIFAEERAVVSPTPEFAVFDLDTNKRRNLVAPQLAGPQSIKHRRARTITIGNATKTFSNSFSRSQTTYELQRSMMQWSVKRAPVQDAFGRGLNLEGPRSWISNGLSNTFSLAGLTFPVAGEWNIAFNCTFYDGFHRFDDGTREYYKPHNSGQFKFNWTIHVRLQPAFLANGPTPFGYNGTAWSPAPTGVVQDINGNAVATSTVIVNFQFQFVPTGTVITATYNKTTSSSGVAKFDDIIVSLPGTYTYQMTAYLSDGTVKKATSSQIVVERALPIRIERLFTPKGTARFHFYETPKFVIYDQLGKAYDPRLNMTLVLASDAPFYSYEGFLTTGTLIGVNSVVQNETQGYVFEFPGISVDLPGTYSMRAAIALPDGSSIDQLFTITVEDTPTFLIPDNTKLSQNRVGVMTIRGVRPNFAEVLLMLSDVETCDNQSSAMISWLPEAPTNNGTTSVTERNFTVVPWARGNLYICMKIPPQETFGALVQNYLPQFDEQYPLVKVVSVSGQDECVALSDIEAATFRYFGWDSAESGRMYGCNLTSPASGTVPPCSCPSHLTCLPATWKNASHIDFGSCQCCSSWVMAVASLCITFAFILMLYVVYEYV